MEKIRLGISACLLGEKFRYDGDHRLDLFLRDRFGKDVEYVSVCPEKECGLGIPREPMHLAEKANTLRLITLHTRQDRTERMIRWARKRILKLEKEGLCGFIFKSRSPSCGIGDVKIYHEKGTPFKKGNGLFSNIFLNHFPLLPVENEEHLHNPELRDHFIERIFTLKRWRDFLNHQKSRGSLVDFHSNHKYLILAHSPKHYQMMGKLVAGIAAFPIQECIRQYQSLLMESLKLMATPRKQANVLQHMMGYFKKQLSSVEKQKLSESIGHYRKGDLFLTAPLTLINHYVRMYQPPYLVRQVYLTPHPLELRLKNLG